MSGRPILTAAAMRAAEAQAITAGASVATLMDRAGGAVAEVVWRYAAAAPTLILCGPGNNGGDGYVAACDLRDRGVAVRVAASGEPRTAAAQAARARWGGAVERLAEAAPAPVLVDALFGTGLTRGIDPATAAIVGRLMAAAQHRLAIDVPSGVDSDGGGDFGVDLAGFDVTIALGALKPAHRLQPAAALCGRVMVADLGLGAVASDLVEIGRPSLPAPGPADQKYTRGMVAVTAGAMAGAALLAAIAAQRAGAGYVVLAGGSGQGGPHALVHRAGTDGLDDPRIGALLCGPGLGRDAAAEAILATVLAAGRPLVLDADALALLTPERLAAVPAPAIVTPHGGEFSKLFGDLPGDKVARARAAAVRAGAVVILKGADTVVAAPDGRAAIAVPAPAWLASAGTGDVLAGTVAAMRARIADPFVAAQAAVWLHSRAAVLAGAVLIADDLAEHLRQAIEECL